MCDELAARVKDSEVNPDTELRRKFRMDGTNSTDNSQRSQRF